jgi:tRNA (guanine10-N2)-dimethyltransferase
MVEAINLLKAHCKADLNEFHNQIALIDVHSSSLCDIHSIFSRLAMTHEVCEFAGSCEVGELGELFSELKISDKKMCVRVRRIGRVNINSVRLERELGAILYKKGARISVSNPEIIIKVYISDRAYTGILVHSTDKKQFLERQPDLKPYFRPGVILPKLARALVNISGIRKGEALLDPMCGAGTILIEAGLMGISFLGVEIFGDIVKGCSRNLLHYRLPANVIQGDVRTLPIKEGSFNAIVTDFPYLKSSRSYGELDELYSDSLNEFNRVLVSDGKAVLISNIDIDTLISEIFRIEERLMQRIHGSLTRRIYLCSR